MRYNNLIKYLIKHKWWVLLAALTIISAAFRFWRLGYINEYIFDEVYYAKMAQDYIIGVSFFDVHPPMVKLIIELGIRLFGDNSVGWRFFEAFFGTLIVPLTFLIADKLFNNKRVAFLAALFISIDGLMLVQSRTALLDSPLIVFDLAAYLTFLICLDTVSKVKAKWWLLGTGIFLGLAAASKWTAIAPFLVIFSFPLYYRKKSLNVPAWYAAIALGIVPFVIYIASFLANHGPSGFFEYVITWHQQTWNYQATL